MIFLRDFGIIDRFAFHGIGDLFTDLHTVFIKEGQVIRNRCINGVDNDIILLIKRVVFPYARIMLLIRNGRLNDRFPTHIFDNLYHLAISHEGDVEKIAVEEYDIVCGHFGDFNVVFVLPALIVAKEIDFFDHGQIRTDGKICCK